MTFEGEYLNGEKNGKGKEYDEYGNIIFDGEYLNGKRWNGKAKEYYKNKKLKFEYDIVNGLVWKGKIYDENGVVIYELTNGNGIFAEYDEYHSLIFEGEYLNGERNWKGKDYDRYGKVIFEGEYIKGNKWNGKGYDYDGNLIYELLNGKGQVKEYEFRKIKFDGEYLNG